MFWGITFWDLGPCLNMCGYVEKCPDSSKTYLCMSEACLEHVLTRLDHALTCLNMLKYVWTPYKLVQTLKWNVWTLQDQWIMSWHVPKSPIHFWNMFGHVSNVPVKYPNLFVPILEMSDYSCTLLEQVQNTEIYLDLFETRSDISRTCLDISGTCLVIEWLCFDMS